MTVSAAFKPHTSRALRVAMLIAPLLFMMCVLQSQGVDETQVTTMSARVPELAVVDAVRAPPMRAEQIRERCAFCAGRASVDVRRLRSYGPAYSSIVVSHALKVVYVPVFKVATTATMWQIAYLEANEHVLNATGNDLDVALHDMGHPAWRQHAILRWPEHHISSVLQSASYLKFGFVRNPYHRLVSAYVDKIQRPTVDSYEYQSQMYSLFGDDVSERSAANITKPSFHRFVTTVASVLNQSTNHAWRQQQFLFEDNRSRRDVHWRPQVELLHPDIIPFDFIGTFDNLLNDRHLVLQWMYQHTHRRIPPHMLEKRHATDPAHKSHLYQIIHDNHQLRQLIVHTYKEDFDTFNFSTQPPAV